MNLTEAVRNVLGNYANFSGRARRSEFWFWGLALFIAYVVLIILTAIARPFLIVLILGVLAIIVPNLSVTWRRLHDTGKSGWYFLLGLIPFVGGIILLVFYCLDSTPGDNQYGPNPKGIGGPMGGGYGQLPPYGQQPGFGQPPSFS